MKKKKLLSMALVICMVLTLLPTVALAASSEMPNNATDKLSVTVNGTTTYYDDHAEGWNAAAGAADGTAVTVKLLADWEARSDGTDNTTGQTLTTFGEGWGFGSGVTATGKGNLCVRKDKSVTLDLNGYKIDRANPTSNGNGCVIRVAGNLTLQDTAGSGKITGGYDSAAGVVVNSSGNFIMTGGSITGNRGTAAEGSDRDFGSGVYVQSGAAFTMTGGSITGNTEGAGVYVSNGDSTVSVGGTAKITGNTKEDGVACNVALQNGAVIGVKDDAPLTEGASIGVTVKSDDFTTNGIAAITGVNSADYSSFFTSDSMDRIFKTGTGEAQVLKLEKTLPITATLNLNSTTATQNCTAKHSHAAGAPPCWSWDQDSRTLTLNGANFQLPDRTAGIVWTPGQDNLITIELSGTNTNTITTREGFSGIFAGSANGDLTIRGGGTLTVTGIFAGKDIKISGGTVNSTVNSTGNNMGISGKSVTISGANTQVTASGIYGISASADPILLDGAKSVTVNGSAQPFTKQPTLKNMVLQSGSGYGDWNNTENQTCLYVYGQPSVTPPSSGGGNSAPSLVTEMKQGGSITLDNLNQMISGKKNLTVTGSDGAKLGELH